MHKEHRNWKFDYFWRDLKLTLFFTNQDRLIPSKFGSHLGPLHKNPLKKKKVYLKIEFWQKDIKKLLLVNFWYNFQQLNFISYSKKLLFTKITLLFTKCTPRNKILASIFARKLSISVMFPDIFWCWKLLLFYHKLHFMYKTLNVKLL